MAKIRVLVVDDSVVVRRMVSDALADDPEIEVGGTAADGRIALSKIEQVNPDLITLDVEMPVMNGLDALRELRKTHRRLPVIMFSTVTERGASATLDALALGATDYVTKPANAGSASAAIEKIRDELIPKIRAYASAAVHKNASISSAAPRALALRSRLTLPRHPSESRVDVVAIGVSTGGPDALAQLIPALPRELPAPVLIVQHMPPIFTRFFADRLSGKSQIPVSEGQSLAPLEPGRAWVAPGDFHMEVERANGTIRIVTHQGPPENSCRPAVDVLFRSVAKVYGTHALGVIMTGMGRDGLRGCEFISEAGGQVIAQDEATSVVWGMPGFVAKAGLAEKILPLDQLAGEIVVRVGESRISERSAFKSRKVGQFQKG